MGARNYQESTVSLPDKFVPGMIGVVTVTFGSGDVLPDFFASLDKQVYRNFILISVDNASKDDTLQQLRAYRGCESVLIANEKNVGVAAGNNQGIRAAIDAGCEHVLLLNNDIVFGGELFQQLLDGLSTYGCQMTTPLIHHHDRPNVVWSAGGYFQPMLGYRCLHFGEGEKDEGQFSKPRAVQYTPTCCVLIRREVFGKIGLMDERYFVYFDDTDFMLRALKAALVLYYLPHARLLHKVSSLTGARSDFFNHYIYRNLGYFLCKHVGGPRTTLYSWMYQASFLVKFVRRKDSKATYLVKRSAFREGLAMASKEWTVSSQS